MKNQNERIESLWDVVKTQGEAVRDHGQSLVVVPLSDLLALYENTEDSSI